MVWKHQLEMAPVSPYWSTLSATICVGVRAGVVSKEEEDVEEAIQARQARRRPQGWIHRSTIAERGERSGRTYVVRVGVVHSTGAQSGSVEGGLSTVGPLVQLVQLDSIFFRCCCCC